MATEHQHVATSVSLDGPNSHRLFHPFDPEGDYSQTARMLPHRQQQGTTAFVTFRLADSIPKKRAKEWVKKRETFIQNNPKPWCKETQKLYWSQFPEKLNEWLDHSEGECLLANSSVASIVENALHHFDGTRYILDNYVIMPNHVHVLVKALGENSLSKIIHTWKSYTAKAINQKLGREGKVWQHESFDHLVRGIDQLIGLRKYILENPNKASLTQGFKVGKGSALTLKETGPSVPLDGYENSTRRRPVATEHQNSTRQRPVATDHQDVATSVPLDGYENSTRQRPVATCINLIIIATRQSAGDFRTGISKHLALAAAAADHWVDADSPQVVGVDLAGYESRETRAHYFREEFSAAHRSGLGITIHAGENDDAEGIWSAILDLNARRLGHALHLAKSPTLLKTVADRRIGVEMCPFANQQIIGFARYDAAEPEAAPDRQKAQPYPLLDYLKAGIPVTVNTDNIGISAASLTDNLLYLAKLCPGIRRLDLLQLLRNALDQAFISPKVRQKLMARFTLPSINSNDTNIK